MSDDILISIVLPVKNSAIQLHKNFCSINEQRYKNFEVVIVYGESDDGTLEFVKQLMASSVVRVSVCQDTGVGLSAAIQLGVQRASGKYILYMGADDTFISPTSLVELADILRNGHYGILFCDACYKTGDKIEYRKAIRYDRKTLLKGNHYSLMNVIFTKDILLTLGFDARYKYVMDYDLYLRMAPYQDSMGYAEKAFVKICSGGDSLSTRNFKKTMKESIMIALRNSHSISDCFFVLPQLPILAREYRFYSSTHKLVRKIMRWSKKFVQLRIGRHS